MKENKCWECLRGIEKKIESGKWKKRGPPLKYWYEMLNAEKEFLKTILSEMKPKSVLEIGTGAGRVIELVLNNSKAKITSLEKDAEMYRLVRERFRNNKRVEIILTKENFSTDKKFDLVLCMINVLGNQKDETEVLKFALSVSDRIVFTLYKKGFEMIRKKIYERQGHIDFDLNHSCFYFHDYWCKGLISKSYSKEDIEKICRKLNCKVKISDLCRIAYIMEIKKHPD